MQNVRDHTDKEGGTGRAKGRMRVDHELVTSRGGYHANGVQLEVSIDHARHIVKVYARAHT